MAFCCTHFIVDPYPLIPTLYIIKVKMATSSACVVSKWDEEQVAEAIVGEFGEEVGKLIRGKLLLPCSVVLVWLV